MDVKSTFLNGYLEEEVYMEQLEGFSLTDNSDYVCKNKEGFVWIETSTKSLAL